MKLCPLLIGLAATFALFSDPLFALDITEVDWKDGFVEITNDSTSVVSGSKLELTNLENVEAYLDDASDAPTNHFGDPEVDLPPRAPQHPTPIRGCAELTDVTWTLHGKNQPAWSGKVYPQDILNSTLPTANGLLSDHISVHYLTGEAPYLVGVTQIDWRRGRPKEDQEGEPKPCLYENGEVNNPREKVWVTHDNHNKLIDIIDGYQDNPHNGGQPLRVPEFDANRQFRVGIGPPGPNGEPGAAGVEGLWANGYVHEWEELTGGYGITEWKEYDPKGLSLATGSNPDGVEGDAYDGGMILLPISFREITEAGTMGEAGGLLPSHPAPVVEGTVTPGTATLNDDGTITGKISISGSVTSDYLDTLKGSEYKISEVSIVVNGEEVDSINVGGTKTATPGNLLRPYAHQNATFSDNADFALIEGDNIVEIQAYDPVLKTPGYITFSITAEVDSDNNVQLKPPETVAKTARGHFDPRVLALDVPQELGTHLDVSIENKDGNALKMIPGPNNNGFLLQNPQDENGYAVFVMIAQGDPPGGNPTSSSIPTSTPQKKGILGILERNDLSPIPALLQFTIGLVGGVIGGGVDTVVGLYKLIEGVTKFTMRNNAVMALSAIQVVFGKSKKIKCWASSNITKLVGDQKKSMEPLYKLAKFLWENFVSKSLENRYKFMLAVSKGQWKDAASALGKEVMLYADVTMKAFEVLGDLWRKFTESESKIQGYYVGVIVFEITALFVSGGAIAIAAAGKLSKLNILTKLKNSAKLRGFTRTADESIDTIADAKRLGWCFAAGTLIATPLGAVPIEHIKVGDLVWSAHEETGEFGYNPVSQLSRRESDNMWNVHYDHDCDPSTTAETIRCTGEHPFWSETEGEFIPACELSSNDLLRLIDGRSVAVEGIEKLRGPPGKKTRVYNFAVANHHTYFAGPGGVWVHNICPAALDRYAAQFDTVLKAGKSFDDAVEEVVTAAVINDKLNTGEASEVVRHLLAKDGRQPLFDMFNVTPGQGINLATPSAANGKSYITYVFKNAEGQVVYVGRSSGTGNPTQVLNRRISRGHDHWDDSLTREVVDTQTNMAACQGAEEFFINGFREVGQPLNNIDEALSFKNAERRGKSVFKIDAFFEDLFAR